VSRPKYAASTDLNQKEIIDALLKIGCSVEIIGKPVDLLVGLGKHNYLIEVKQAHRRGRKDQEDQHRWIRDWPGQVRVCSSPEEAILLVTEAYGRQIEKR